MNKNFSSGGAAPVEDIWDILAADTRPRVPFRGMDRYSISDRRECLRWEAGQRLEFDFPAEIESGGSIEVVAMPQVFEDHTYVHRFLNGVLGIELNGKEIFHGMVHWRSHEETASFWQRLCFAVPADVLKSGSNRLVLTNHTSRAALGDFFDPGLDEALGPQCAEAKLGTWFLAEVMLRPGRTRVQVPRICGIPRSAVAGEAFLIEVVHDAHEGVALAAAATNATVKIEAPVFELGAFRSLVHVTPAEPGRAVQIKLVSGGTELKAVVETIYSRMRARDLVVGGGIESLFWHELPDAFGEIFANEAGNAVRVSIDDYVNNLHAVPVERWKPLVSYLVRRGIRFALQRLRVPPYSRISHADLVHLANLGGPLFLGASIPEPVHHIGRPSNEKNLAMVLAEYLTFFREQLEQVRLPGHPVITFDAGSSMAGQYYAEGLDVHLSETGPACNVYEESCARGAASAWDKPWGIVAAMMWYYGQGAQYACDESRVRLSRLIAYSAYLAGASQVLWEGGTFDNLPVYQYVLTPESRRDYERGMRHPALVGIRCNMTDLLNFHRAQQLPSPKVRCAFLQGANDLYHGLYSNTLSALGDMAPARSWRMLKAFLPHVGARRGPVPHDGPSRRWFSWTPFGPVDVVPSRSPSGAFARYGLLAIAGWNTMDEALYGRLVEYADGGGTLVLSLPHLTSGDNPELDWKPFNNGDFTVLCGVRLRGMGGRIETIHARSGLLEGWVPDTFTLSDRNPLFPGDFDESYPVYGHDITYLGGSLDAGSTTVHAVSQSGDPVLLEHRLGNGRVFLINTWFLPGRGRQLDYATEILRALAVSMPGQPRLVDPTERVAWFEYEEPGFRRFVFLQTDWPNETASSEVEFWVEGVRLRFAVGHMGPVQVLWDGGTAVLGRDPDCQIRGWEPGKDGPRIHLRGGKPESLQHLHGPRPEVFAD